MAIQGVIAISRASYRPSRDTLARTKLNQSLTPVFRDNMNRQNSVSGLVWRPFNRCFFFAVSSVTVPKVSEPWEWLTWGSNTLDSNYSTSHEWNACLRWSSPTNVDLGKNQARVMFERNLPNKFSETVTSADFWRQSEICSRLSRSMIATSKVNLNKHSEY